MKVTHSANIYGRYTEVLDHDFTGRPMASRFPSWLHADTVKELLKKYRKDWLTNQQSVDMQ